MSREIAIVEKPEYVSWNSIHEVLWAAHESTRQACVYYPTSEMSGDELREFIAKRSGHCLVAMDGEKVVGTMSYYIQEVSTKMFEGRFLMLALIGNVPAYKGKHIFSKLYNLCYDYAKVNGLDGLMYGTAEKNYTMRRIFENKGFVYNRFYYNQMKKRFVVGGIYSFEKLPHKKFYYTLLFRMRQVLLHLRYTNQGNKRFGI